MKNAYVNVYKFMQVWVENLDKSKKLIIYDL